MMHCACWRCYFIMRVFSSSQSVQTDNFVKVLNTKLLSDFTTKTISNLMRLIGEVECSR